MMTGEEQEHVLDMLVATAEVMGTEIKPNAVALMVKDLSAYDFNQVMMALTRCRRELAGKLTLKAILDILAPAGGWLSGNQAWALALPAADENKTVVWSVEARKAWFIALPLVEAGDKVAGRMAFIETYDRLVAQARIEGKEPLTEISSGQDPLLRETAISQAVERGQLPPPVKSKALPAPVDDARAEMQRQRIQAGLKELALSMRGQCDA